PPLFISYLRDVTDRKQNEAALTAAKIEAERANTAKSEFLSRMSHELRTPLNAILGFGQLLEMDELDAAQRTGVEQILKAGRGLLELVNEVLDITRIEAGYLEMSPEPLSVREMVREALGLIEPLAAASKIRIFDEISPTCPFYVRGDRQRLNQALLNLLANAVKYNREGGAITLTWREGVMDRRQEDRGRRLTDKESLPVELAAAVAAPVAQNDEPLPTLCIQVTDTGIGIPAESMSRLFMPFERLGAEHSAIEGTGVGLALSKRLIDLMGGRITVESVVGGGSTFTIELPMAETQTDYPAKRDGDKPQFPQSTSTTMHTVLYIEDNPSNLNLVEQILLRREGMHLLSAIQGEAGLALAREHQPDLILLDLHLPDINGDEVLRRLQNDATTQAIPVVILSADATPHQIERLLAYGAVTYLTKPLDVQQFLQVLDETL
ncbi:MAG TPA: ATP-binding protein, partial [Abditibacteriaceae bacterium]